MHNYRSFQQIEADLRVLKLKKQVDLLFLKNSISSTKQSLSFKAMMANFLGGLGLLWQEGVTKFLFLPLSLGCVTF
nr:DUF6327 family protein [Capnocytophaga canimorsus]